MRRGSWPSTRPTLEALAEAADGGYRPDGELAAAIDDAFGSFDAFSKRLSTATTSVQGSGWGVLGYEPLSTRLIIEQLYDHHGNVGLGSTPLLVFDACEHAYYLQYRNVRPDYFTRLWDLVDWANVAARHRGDLKGADELLGDLDDRSRAAGALFLADLAVALLARAEGRDVDAVAAELSLHIAAVGDPS